MCPPASRSCCAEYNVEGASSRQMLVMPAANIARDSKDIVSYQDQIVIHTTGHGDMHDLTEKVAAIVASSEIRTGTANIFNIGSTAAVGTIEFEPGLQQDLPSTLDKLIPPSRHYGHEQAWHDGNGHSHLQATLLGPSLTVPIVKGKLALGTWQQIFHLECDLRGRQRTVIVTVVGE
jgi:secondary thiamine-phosphate synthase enzyme